MLPERRSPILEGMAATPHSPHRIVLLTFDQAQVLDVTGPLEVFSTANREWVEERPERAAEPPLYELEVVTFGGGPVRTTSGLALEAGSAREAAERPIDTLIVAGGDGTRSALRDAELVEWVRIEGRKAPRLVSVCTGAFLLAAAGLLDGRRATTHWRNCDDLARFRPQVRVERDPIFVRDGHVHTSAGICAGMDLALALLEADHGRDLALAVAQRLVVFLRRAGGQSQFSAQLQGQIAEREPLRDLQAWILEHPADDLSVESLARRVAMSPRNFARVFAREVGITPARFVERVRVEAARRRLEETEAAVEQVAEACGFGTAETMRRAFLRGLRVSPAAYRERFRGPGPRATENGASAPRAEQTTERRAV